MRRRDLAEAPKATAGRQRRQAIRALPSPGLMSDEALQAEIDALMDRDAHLARRWECPDPNCDGAPHAGWLHRHARGKQHMPRGAWYLWLMMTGRGWGKTRTSAETVRQWVQVPGTSVAVIARKQALARTICFEAKRAGLLAVIPTEQQLRYKASSDDLRLTLTNGSVIYGFSAEVPDNLRGHAFDKAWCDEYGAWSRKTAQDTWDQLMFCMREAPNPQTIVSTTPRGNRHMKRLLEKARKGLAAEASTDDPQTAEEEARPKRRKRRAVLTTGSMHENAANLNDDFLDETDESYGGTRLGAQEIEGLLLEDVEGALWTPSTFDYDGEYEFRLDHHLVPPMDYVVVSVDPATTSKATSDNTAITVAGRSYHRNFSHADGMPRAFVMHTEQARNTPRKAMQRAIDLYHTHMADALVVETNNGGDYLEEVVHMLDPTVNVVQVNASRNKRARAAPVAALYEKARVFHVGLRQKFRELEEQMTTYVGLGGEDEEDSPDMLDSLVWAITALLLDKRLIRRRGRRDKRLAGRR